MILVYFLMVYLAGLVTAVGAGVYMARRTMRRLMRPGAVKPRVPLGQ